MSRTVPYTHYAYFKDRDVANACGRELDERFDCLTYVKRSAARPDEWLLRAARTVTLGIPWHREVEEVVESYGGRYDGGEACMFVPPSNGPTESAP